jgi:hypothetical protein
MTPSGSEVTSRPEEVDFLRTQVDRLHALVAELLAKNQHLRKTLEEGSLHADASSSLGASEPVGQAPVSEMTFKASFVYELGRLKQGRSDRGKIENDD